MSFLFSFINFTVLSIILDNVIPQKQTQKNPKNFNINFSFCKHRANLQWNSAGYLKLVYRENNKSQILKAIII